MVVQGGPQALLMDAAGPSDSEDGFWVRGLLCMLRRAGLEHALTGLCPALYAGLEHALVGLCPVLYAGLEHALMGLCPVEALARSVHCPGARTHFVP